MVCGCVCVYGRVRETKIKRQKKKKNNNLKTDYKTEDINPLIYDDIMI